MSSLSLGLTASFQVMDNPDVQFIRLPRNCHATPTNSTFSSTNHFVNKNSSNSSFVDPRSSFSSPIEYIDKNLSTVLSNICFVDNVMIVLVLSAPRNFDARMRRREGFHWKTIPKARSFLAKNLPWKRTN